MAVSGASRMPRLGARRRSPACGGTHAAARCPAASSSVCWRPRSRCARGRPCAAARRSSSERGPMPAVYADAAAGASHNAITMQTWRRSAGWACRPPAGEAGVPASERAGALAPAASLESRAPASGGWRAPLLVLHGGQGQAGVRHVVEHVHEGHVQDRRLRSAERARAGLAMRGCTHASRLPTELLQPCKPEQGLMHGLLYAGG